MADSRTLQRLLRLRELQEEQSRTELEEAVVGRDRILEEANQAMLRRSRGQRAFAEGIMGNDAVGRAGGLMEIDQAARTKGRVSPRLEAANLDVIRRREQFFERRTDRRQVNTLLDQAKLSARAESDRKDQQRLDDWYARQARASAQAHKKEA